MPAVYLFDRRTRWAGDDLWTTMLILWALRLLQFIFCILPLFHHLANETRGRDDDEDVEETTRRGDCTLEEEEESNTTAYLVFLFIYATCSALYSVIAAVFSEGSLLYWTFQGTPTTERELRTAKVTKLLQHKLTLFPITLLLIWIMGFIVIALAKDSCQRSNNQAKDVVRFSGGVLMLTQLCEFVFSWSYFYKLVQEPKRRHESRAANERTHSQRSLEVDDSSFVKHQREVAWEERCACICKCLTVSTCYLLGGKETSGAGQSGLFGDIAGALTDFLEEESGVLDLVPSDVMAGFLILQRLQESRVHESRQAVVTSLRLSQAAASSSIPNLEEGDDVVKDMGIVAANPSGATPEQAIGQVAEQPATTGSDEEKSNYTSEQPIAESSQARTKREQLTSSLAYRYNTRAGVSYDRAILSVHKPTDLHALAEGERYIKHAFAMYSWLMHLYVYPITGFPRLMTKGSCLCCLCRFQTSKRKKSAGLKQNKKDEDGIEQPKEDTDDDSVERCTAAELAEEHGVTRIRGENLCGLHRAAVLVTAGLDDADLVYLQLQSGFHDSPYAIMLDHEWKTVVVAIRGTFSLEDCITDVLMDPVPLDEVGREFDFDGVGQHCHHGVLQHAQNIYRDLQDHKLLNALLLDANALHPDYRLRVVGHSLGAGAAVMLSQMLRKQFPDLSCVSYAPPGCTLSWDLAIQCREWCTSFCLDSDIVPRLSVDALEQWRDELLELVGRIKVPKAKVYQRLMVYSRDTTPTSSNNQKRRRRRRRGRIGCCYDPPLEDSTASIDDLRDILYEPDEVPDNEYKRHLEKFKLAEEQQRTKRGDFRAVKLFPPGRLIHLVKTEEKPVLLLSGLYKCLTCCTTNFGYGYTPVWIDNGDLNEFIISPRMANDHMPDRIQQVLGDVAGEYRACKDGFSASVGSDNAEVP